jgi:ribonuclease P protein component
VADSCLSAAGPRAGSSSPLPTRRRSTRLPEPGGGCAIARNDFSKNDRVRTKTDIDRVFSSGARFSCKGMRLHVLANGLGRNRVVFVPVRSFPNAVARNRAKRVMRECWRLGKDGFISLGHDCAVVIFPGSDDLAERSMQLSRLLRQAGIAGGTR